MAVYFSSAVLLSLTVASVYKVLKIGNACYVLEPSQLQGAEGGKPGMYGQNAMHNKYKEDYRRHTVLKFYCE